VAEAVQVHAPLVSVAIPAYKGAAYIAETIESVLAQSLRDLELIVVDDCSPDGTAEIVAAYHDPRVRLYRNESNLGPQGNWNRCLHESRGRYFKLLPQDDVLMPDCLEKQVAVLEADASESISLVFCARTIVLPNGRRVMQRGYPGMGGEIPGRYLLNRCVRRGSNLIGEPGAGMFRRSLAAKVGGYDASNPYVVDLDYWFRLLQMGNAYYLDEPLITFRVSGSSWSVDIGRQQGQDFCDFLRRVKVQMEPNNDLDFFCGCGMARVNGILRKVFYHLWLR
jgi:glycosyltransferase involved in cell wall biosynthesis